MASYRKNLLHCVLENGISSWRNYNHNEKDEAFKDYLYPNKVVSTSIIDVNEERVNNIVDTDASGLNTDLNDDLDEDSKDLDTENENEDTINENIKEE